MSKAHVVIGRRQSVVFHDDIDCWGHYEPWNCACPDTGSVHHDGHGRPCSELRRVAWPTRANTDKPPSLGQVALERLCCDTCGLELPGET